MSRTAELFHSENEGIAVLRIDDSGNTIFSMVDSNGELVSGDYVTRFTHGIAGVRNGEANYFVNALGNKISKAYDWVNDCSTGIAPVKHGNNYGWIKPILDENGLAIAVEEIEVFMEKGKVLTLLPEYAFTDACNVIGRARVSYGRIQGEIIFEGGKYVLSVYDNSLKIKNSDFPEE